MWFQTTVHAYDAMGHVVITATVTSRSGLGEEQSPVGLHATTTVAGVGETDPRQWLEDALVALLETL